MVTRSEKYPNVKAMFARKRQERRRAERAEAQRLNALKATFIESLTIEPQSVEEGLAYMRGWRDAHIKLALDFQVK